MRRQGLIELTPRTVLLLVITGISFAFLRDAPGASASDSPAGDRDVDRYLLGIVAPEPGLAGSDLAGLAPAGGAGLADAKAVWEEIPPAVRLGHSAAFDAAHKRMVVFGGLDGENFSNKTWVFAPGPIPSWELLGSKPRDAIDYTLGDSTRRPSPRTGQATVMVRDRLLVIGGFDVRGPRRDVWALDMAAGSEKWTNLVVDAPDSLLPRPRSGHTAVYVDAPDSLLPRPRSGHTAVYDVEVRRAAKHQEPLGDRVLVFGGTAGDLDFLGDVWELHLGADSAKWTKLDGVDSLGPSARVGHTAVYDPIGKRMLVFGGLDEQLELLNDTWELSLSERSDSPKWRPIEPSGEAPKERIRHAAVFDAKHNRMLIFAGVNGPFQLDDLWELSLGGAATWKPIEPTGARPPGRLGPSAVIDAPYDRMLVFGGSRGGVDLNDTWALPLRGTPKWALVSPPEGEPGARLGHAAVYDPVRDRMLMVGGFDGSEPLIDVWELPLGERPCATSTQSSSAANPSGRMSWRQLRIPGEAPPARSGHTAVYDRERDRLLVFGGLNLVYLDDLWELSLGGQQRWTRLMPGGDPLSLVGPTPSGRTDHTAIYDPRRDRIVIFGGVGVAGRTGDAWQLSLGDPMAWTLLEVEGTHPPAGRSAHVAVYDSLYDRMVVWGGTTSDGSPPDAWELCFGEGSEPGSCTPGSPTWKPLTQRGTAPPWQFGQSAVHDPIGNRMVLFAGGFQESRRLEFGNQVYELTLCDTSTWKSIEPTGDRPRARAWHSAIYDPVRVCMVVYGGGRIARPRSYRADLWTLTLGAAATPEPVVGAGPPGGSGWEDRTGDFDPQGLALVLGLGSPQPNPTSGEAAVVFTLPGDDVARIEVVDVRGRRVLARDLGSLGAGTHTLRIAERGALAAGVYFVRLSYGARMLTGKLAVLH